MYTDYTPTSLIRPALMLLTGILLVLALSFSSVGSYLSSVASDTATIQAAAAASGDFSLESTVSEGIVSCLS